MLYTNLKHIESADEQKKFIHENENVMICCGRMSHTCIPVYEIMEELEGHYKYIKFADMEYDNPESHIIKNSPECADFTRLPYIVYYKNGNPVKSTTGIQTLYQVKSILNKTFGEIKILNQLELQQQIN